MNKNMEIISLIFGALLVGLVVVFLSPFLYDKAKQLYIDHTAKAKPVLNVIKVKKIDFSEQYVGGGNFFHTVDGKGRLIHLSPDFSEELVLRNLALGFFDIPEDCSECTHYMFHLKNTNNKSIKDIEIRYRVKGKIYEPNIKSVSQNQTEKVSYGCKDNLCTIRIESLPRKEILSFGILVGGGELLEVTCELRDGVCAISHLGLHYTDVMFGKEVAFLNYNGKEYSLPAINRSSIKKDYQLINGIWTEYK